MQRELDEDEYPSEQEWEQMRQGGGEGHPRTRTAHEGSEEDPFIGR